MLLLIYGERSPCALRAGLHDKIKCRGLAILGVAFAQQQRWVEDRIPIVCGFVGEIQLRGQHRAVGRLHPVADNSSPQGRAQNRRVEIDIVDAPL